MHSNNFVQYFFFEFKIILTNVRIVFHFFKMSNDRTTNDDQLKEEQIDSMWQELTGISADPPEQRDICECCRYGLSL